LVANSQEHAATLLNVLKSTLPFIRVGSFQIGTKVNYLDVELTLVPNNSPNNRLPFVSHVGVCRAIFSNGKYLIESKLYRKPSDLVVLLDFFSAHTRHTKFGVVLGQLVRIINISTNIQSAGCNIRHLLELMCMLRNFPLSSRRTFHIRILKYVIRSMLKHATHSVGTRVNGNQQCESQCNVHMLIPLQVDIRYFAALFRDINSRMSGIRLCARNECNRNLLCTLTHISV
jgi:hypothetical protein